MNDSFHFGIVDSSILSQSGIAGIAIPANRDSGGQRGGYRIGKIWCWTAGLPGLGCLPRPGTSFEGKMLLVTLVEFEQCSKILK